MRLSPAWPATRTHPNSRDIEAVLRRVPDLSGAELEQLAASFHDSGARGAARGRALSPDIPWVVDTLRVFDTCERLYAAEECGPGTLARALRAMRDAVAAVFARPLLHAGDYDLLLEPWRCAVDAAPSPVPDAVGRALALIAGLADRCHDDVAALRWLDLEFAATVRDNEAQRDAAEAAHSLALRARRERSWEVVRRCATEAASRRCTACGRRPDLASVRVLALAVDGACGLLVADLAAPEMLRTVSGPLLDWLH